MDKQLTSLTQLNASQLDLAGGHKMMVEVGVSGEQLNQWLSDNGADVRRLLAENGALLLRNIDISGSKKLARVLSGLFDGPLLDYQYRSTPRTKMRGQVYTSSEYHPDETIALHNESSYANAWAMNIGFYCSIAAPWGGATPIADSRRIYQAMPTEVREVFERRQLLYVRNYGELDLPWNEVFQTDDRQQVESYCRDNAIEFEWRSEQGLRTKQRCSPVCEHPLSGEKVWFNQAHLFHVSSLSEDNRSALLSVVDSEDLPRNVYYGDGGQIADETLAIIRQVYHDHMIVFDWQAKDLLLLDNMRFAHGRQPYSGNRRILVGMSHSHGR